MSLNIYNTLTQQKKAFKPLVKQQVRMYVCGMTVYDFCHLGHGRVMVAFDVISRYLRVLGYQVVYVRNITDIDDKIIERAHLNQESISALTTRMINAMHEDEARLNVLLPDIEPRATDHIADIIQMITVLIEKGYAYAVNDGDVYFHIRSFKDYGKLNHLNIDELRVGARIAVDPEKRDPLDFVLWKKAKNGEESWPSPWGNGRPGWHIECSAMSTHCLGNSFDIHGGGPDLKFPHHENEIAQSEAATGQPFAQIWMHVGPVRVDNEKMSKSLNNFFTLREIFQQHDPEVVRFFLLASHYRSPLNYSVAGLIEARRSLTRMYRALADITPSAINIEDDLSQRFFAAMNDDFNTPEALAVLFELVRIVNRAKKNGQLEKANNAAAQLQYLGQILGLLERPASEFSQANASLDNSAIEAQINLRTKAKVMHDFAEADRIRSELLRQGIVLEDTHTGTRWSYDESELDS